MPSSEEKSSPREIVGAGGTAGEFSAEDSILVDPDDPIAREFIRTEAASGAIRIARCSGGRTRIIPVGGAVQGRESARDRIRSAVLSARIKLVREECFGPDGTLVLAAYLGVDQETWSGYESWVTIPGPILLEFIAITSARPAWLLSGAGPRYEGGSAG
ncbi:hypothetical protein TA3x_005112 [Tundrisphaera sp. TA3]|uniref:hypothetical protein n=1 Tax=Tundrisphaera sp. TA3 TaxID=3435775 RepID=UPI003EBC1E63